jgi:sugar/nucleoside kinase (ribokinase family)
MSKDSRVTCVGDLMWVIERPLGDLPRTNRTCVVRGDKATLGGSAWNIVEHLAALRQPAEFVALVGAMDRAVVLDELKLKEIDSSGLIPYDGPTNVLVAFLGNKSTRSVFVCGKNASHGVAQLADRLAGESTLIFGGSRDKLVRSAVLERVERGSCSFVFAPSYSVFVHKPDELLRFSKSADVVVLNEAEFRFFSEAIGGKQRSLDSQRCCIVTRGHRGATVYVGKRGKRIPSSSGSDDDVIGAGDAFLAAFIVSWLRCRDPILAGQAGGEFAGNFVRTKSPNPVARLAPT